MVHALPIRRLIRVAALCAALGAASGCGGDDKSGDANSQDARMQDAQAKSDVRNLVTNVEACYTEQQTYEPCGAPESLSDAGLPLGSGLGQVELQAADAQTYEAAAHSRSGSTFRILKQADGTTKRICAAAGHGGCPANGSW